MRLNRMRSVAPTLGGVRGVESLVLLQPERKRNSAAARTAWRSKVSKTVCDPRPLVDPYSGGTGRWRSAIDASIDDSRSS